MGDPNVRQIMNLPNVLIETLLMLSGMFASALAMLDCNHRKKLVGWFSVTFLLSLGFVVMAVSEYSDLIAQGYTWQLSGFLSAYLRFQESMSRTF